ncbi:MAG: glycosyltransferase family 4 protein, partial [Candidatus Krumholzibacteriota bacterium]
SRKLLNYYCRRDGISHLIAFHSKNAGLCVDANIGCIVICNVRSIKFSVDKGLANKYRDIMSRADGVVTNSENTARLLIEKKIAPDWKIRVIHNAIYLPELKPSHEEGTILYVGSIKSIKDPLTFTRACEYVIGQKRREARVIMVGEGPMRKAVADYIKRNNLERHFVLTGEIPPEQIPYREASVFVNSSVRESSSNSILEALSFGVPVVASDNPGNRDILAGLKYHQLVPVSDFTAMGEAIDGMLCLSDGERREVFEESRAFIRDNYCVPEIVDQYVRLLKKL